MPLLSEKKFLCYFPAATVLFFLWQSSRQKSKAISIVCYVRVANRHLEEANQAAEKVKNEERAAKRYRLRRLRKWSAKERCLFYKIVFSTRALW